DVYLRRFISPLVSCNTRPYSLKIKVGAGLRPAPTTHHIRSREVYSRRFISPLVSCNTRPRSLKIKVGAGLRPAPTNHRIRSRDVPSRRFDTTIRGGFISLTLPIASRANTR